MIQSFFPLLHVACHFLLESLSTKEKILTNPKIQLPDYNKKKEKQHVEQHNLHLHQPYIATRGLKPKDHLCTFLNVCCILKLSREPHDNIKWSFVTSIIVSLHFYWVDWMIPLLIWSQVQIGPRCLLWGQFWAQHTTDKTC